LGRKVQSTKGAITYRHIGNKKNVLYNKCLAEEKFPDTLKIA